MAYCSAPTSCPVLIPDAKEVELNWCWFLSGKVYFASFLVTAYAKCSITSSSSTTCWKLSVSTQAGHSALMWGSIHLPQHEVKYSQTTHTEGCWLLRLCSTFTALAVLKFNYFLTQIFTQNINCSERQLSASQDLFGRTLGSYFTLLVMAALAETCFSSVKLCLYMFDPFGETAKAPRLISNLPKIHSLLDRS